MVASSFRQFSETRGTQADGDGRDASRKDASDERLLQRKEHRVAASPYSEAELEEVVEVTLSRLFSSSRDDCSFEELYQVWPSNAQWGTLLCARPILYVPPQAMAVSDNRVVASGRKAVIQLLDAMEMANKVVR